MAIVFDKENRLFTLCTKNSMYQMKADDKGILLHTYYCLLYTSDAADE